MRGSSCCVNRAIEVDVDPLSFIERYGTSTAHLLSIAGRLLNKRFYGIVVVQAREKVRYFAAHRRHSPKQSTTVGFIDSLSVSLHFLKQ